MKTPKERVKRVHSTAVSQPPNPRGLYYDEWTVYIPPTARGMFGYMKRIIGHGPTANKAWDNAAKSL